MTQAARQFKFPCLPPVIERPKVAPPPEFRLDGDASANKRNQLSDHGGKVNTVSLSSLEYKSQYEHSCDNDDERCVLDDADVDRELEVRQPSTMDLIKSILRETPGVTLKLFRFYGILFLIIRPLIRMKNPWRKRFEILRDLLGAVVSVTVSRFGFSVASLWQTRNPSMVQSFSYFNFANHFHLLSLIMFHSDC